MTAEPWDPYSPGWDSSVPRHRPACEPLDWSEFWSRPRGEPDWLVEPLLPRGRQVALAAEAKQGKSLLALEVAAAVATGRPVLGQPAGEPRGVVYLDMEMTEDDVRERLGDLGYGPGDDLSCFLYYLLPDMPPLNEEAGGEAVEAIVQEHGADLVVIDTLGRVVDGEENSNDTVRGFYRHTGMRLKRLGVTVLRLDHKGKDGSRGQRGGSAKNDDVDVVWDLTPTDDGVRLSATHRRMRWVPDRMVLRRDQDPLRHTPTEKLWPPGTVELAAVLDELDVPLDASRRRAAEQLQAAGKSARTEVVGAAVRWRREAA